jgi:hypothetical protein
MNTCSEMATGIKIKKIFNTTCIEIFGTRTTIEE